MLLKKNVFLANGPIFFTKILLTQDFLSECSSKPIFEQENSARSPFLVHASSHPPLLAWSHGCAVKTNFGVGQNFSQITVRLAKMTKMAEKRRFFSFFTYGHPSIVFYSLLDVLTKFQVNWSTKTRFIWIIVFSYFQYTEIPRRKC